MGSKRTKNFQMFLSFYIISILFATGVCLQCEQCSSSTESCIGTPHVCRKSENACMILTMETTIGNDKWLATYKGCTELKYCLPSPMSFTFPSQRRRKAATCCRKDLCNSGKVTQGKIYNHAKRGCGTKHACMNEPRIFGVPGLYMEIVKSPQCTPAPKILTKIGK
ncbi:hypothetical protein JD844_005768 [Phrynosoma platyrhinos]|uniref:UPAR/Ly6 domain-containing protein n=1 Tax=Phrynosoma platyrhinos TaxID=52577 RepID=A0ABQ7TPN7_PHRPL|nr:hypothetical protein JD844_005768 [Phrynosoma platyrhinos]